MLHGDCIVAARCRLGQRRLTLLRGGGSTGGVWPKRKGWSRAGDVGYLPFVVQSKSVLERATADSAQTASSNHRMAGIKGSLPSTRASYRLSPRSAAQLEESPRKCQYLRPVLVEFGESAGCRYPSRGCRRRVPAYPRRIPNIEEIPGLFGKHEPEEPLAINPLKGEHVPE